MPVFVRLVFYLGLIISGLSRGVFEHCMSARAEAFSLVKCLGTTEFLAVGTVSSTLIMRRLPPNHNYNKIVKSDWLSTALISALIGQFNRTVRVMPK